MTEQNYGVCQDCGAEKVLNPKTGKTFCKNKCWLTKKDGNQVSQLDRIEKKIDELMKIIGLKNIRPNENISRTDDLPF